MSYGCHCGSFKFPVSASLCFLSHGFAYKNGSRAYFREHSGVLTGTTGIYSVSKNLVPTLIYFYLGSRLQVCLAPTLSFILPSFFFSLELECEAGVALRESSVFKFLSFVLHLHTGSPTLPRVCLFLFLQLATLSLLTQILA